MSGQLDKIDLSFIFRSLQTCYAIEKNRYALDEYPVGKDIDILTNKVFQLINEISSIINTLPEFNTASHKHSFIKLSDTHLQLDILYNNQLVIKFDIWSSYIFKFNNLVVSSELIELFLARRRNYDGIYFLAGADMALARLLAFLDSGRLKQHHRNAYSSLTQFERFEIRNIAAHYLDLY